MLAPSFAGPNIIIHMMLWIKMQKRQIKGLLKTDKKEKNYKNILVDEDAPADLPDHRILPNN